MRCPQCGRGYKLPPSLEGKRGACKDCGAEIAIRRAKPKPALRPETEPEPPPLRAPSRRGEHRKPSGGQLARLVEKLDELEEVRRPFPSIMYLLWLPVVAAVMFVLPLVYLAMTAGIGWLTWWHATNNVNWIMVPKGRGWIVVWIAYFLFIILGVLWFISMLMPLLLRPTRQKSEVGGLRREHEPALFAVIDRLAEALGTPQPESIQLVFNVNASASYDTRFFGLLRSNFMLTIGVPVVAGMTVSELCGLIAWQVGHFTQRGGSIIEEFIRRVNLWFIGAVYLETPIDALIESMTNDPDEESNASVVMGMMLWCLVGMGRCVVFLLMVVGMLFSTVLLRRTEYIADRYGVAVIGAKKYATMLKRMETLKCADEIAEKHVFASLRGDYLPRDYAGFIAGLADKSAVVKKKARKRTENEKGGLLKTEPVVRARIRAVERSTKEGVLHSELPASALFGDFDKLSRSVSNHFYEKRFGSGYSPDTRRTTKEAVRIYLETMETEREE